MRILISALLLALGGGKKNSKCITGEELTNSYVPAGLQIISHYLSQIFEVINQKGTGRSADERRPEPPPSLPTIEVSYYFNNISTINNTVENSSSKLLANLAWALNREAKDQSLANCKGLASDVLIQLEKSSRVSASHQLTYVLQRISDGEVRRQESKMWIKKAVAELNDLGSNLNADLKFLKPLRYLSEVSLE